jgi:TetR/AcrR family transcriptional repressor of uid operon
MNIHSHVRPMSLESASPITSQPGAACRPTRASDAERRARIVKAAERAFVRHGFHATTMQHVAEEAGMSAGNLYRYFPSKEAIVEGLCLVDQDERAGQFAALARNADLVGAIGATLREHLLSKPPEKARLVVEIWAEAGRNARIASITRALDANVLGGLTALAAAAKASGAVSPTLDPEFAARVVFTLVAGLFKRLALEPAFEVEAELAMTMAIMKALFAGALSPASGRSGEGG